jgi:hypothetical protein
MKKRSAQPTGNGKRIIIIITTLHPFRECLQAVGKKKEEDEEKSSFPSSFFIM